MDIDKLMELKKEMSQYSEYDMDRVEILEIINKIIEENNVAINDIKKLFMQKNKINFDRLKNHIMYIHYVENKYEKLYKKLSEFQHNHY